MCACELITLSVSRSWSRPSVCQSVCTTAALMFSTTFWPKSILICLTLKVPSKKLTSCISVYTATVLRTLEPHYNEFAFKKYSAYKESNIYLFTYFLLFTITLKRKIGNNEWKFSVFSGVFNTGCLTTMIWHKMTCDLWSCIQPLAIVQ